MKKVNIYLSILLLFLLVGLSSVYAGYEEGLAAYDRRDYETAFQEFKPLAEQGDELAQYNLGAMYYNGQGVPRDYVMAYMWFNLAAAQGQEVAKVASGLRNISERVMTPEQIAEAQRLSREFKVKSP